LDSLANGLNTTPAYLMGWEKSTERNTKKTELCRTHELKYCSRWIDEISLTMLTDEERTKLFEYAKFLMSIRNK
jgi:hypothetical protein